MMMMMMMRPYKTWNISLFPQVNQTQIYFGAAWFWKVCQVTASVLCSAADATLQVHEISQQCVLSRMLSFPLIQIHQEFSFGHCENWQNAAKHFTNSWYNFFHCFVCWSEAVCVRWLEVGSNGTDPMDAADLVSLQRWEKTYFGIFHEPVKIQTPQSCQTRQPSPTERQTQTTRSHKA